jgi:5-methylthioadenosine/S-adenosylhomocysteine deaminase
MRDGKVQSIDEKRTVAEAQAVAERAWSRLFDHRPDLTPPPGFAPAPPVSRL